MHRVLFLVFVLSGLQFGESGHATEIRNFKAGLVCPDRESGRIGDGRVCFETETVHVTGQGRCTYDGEDLPCTWHGYEFEYSGAEPGQKISCIVKNSVAVNYGNPDGVAATDAQTYDYELDLEKTEGRFFNPQYVLFTTVSPDAPQEIEETVCSSRGEELFRFRFLFLYPPSEVTR